MAPSQRNEDEIGAHVAGEATADDPAAVGVDDEAEEHYALPAAGIVKFREPHRIREIRKDFGPASHTRRADFPGLQ